MKLLLSKNSVDGSSGEGSWALLECLAQPGASDKESQEGAGEGCDEEDEEEDEEEDGVNDAEAVERPKGKSRAKRKRVALGERVASIARRQGLHAKRAPNGPVDLCSTIARGEDFLCVAPNQSTIQ